MVTRVAGRPRRAERARSRFLRPTHGCGARRGRRASGSGAQVGYVIATTTMRPATDSDADFAAAREAMFTVRDRTHWSNAWWADPVLLGAYPSDGLELFGPEMPKFPANDLETM